MKELVGSIVSSLVDNPHHVQVDETSNESGAVLVIRVAQEDVGKVIGKEGRIANAIRTVAKAAAAKSARKITVEIISNQPSSTAAGTSNEPTV